MIAFPWRFKRNLREIPAYHRCDGRLWISADMGETGSARNAQEQYLDHGVNGLTKMRKRYAK